MDKKIRPIYMLSTRDPPQKERCKQTKSKGMKKIFMQVEIKKKKAGVAILTSEKIDFNTRR